MKTSNIDLIIGSMLWLSEYPSEGAKRFPEKNAIVCENSRLSYSELDRFSNNFAGYLGENGFKPGSRVAYLGKNSEMLFPVLFGCIRAGVVLVPMNWRCAAPEIGFMLQDSGTTLLLTDEEFLDKVKVAISSLENPPILILTNSIKIDHNITTLRTVLRNQIVNKHRWEETVNECALLMYTSGTTGKPKGVMLSHKSLSIARHIEIDSPDWADWHNTDVILSPMPNFHIGGLSWMFIGLRRGLTCVLTADASPANILDLIEHHKITRVFIVPTVIRALLDLVINNRKKPPRIATILYGAAAMDVTLLTKSIDTFGCQFGQFFGMTENCGTVTFLPPISHDKNRPDLLLSVGKALPLMEIEIRNPDMKPCVTRTPGEIWIKSPTLMLGYWNNAKESNNVLLDNWYRSGDGGYLDEEGYLYLTDRIKDMIISGGENIYPIEVEVALRRHQAVRDVVVVGRSDPTWGEIVTAVIEWNDNQSATLEELRETAEKYIASYKLPKEMHCVTTLPRTATGKLQRSIVKSNLKK